jgi:hypothetical protein
MAVGRLTYYDKAKDLSESMVSYVYEAEKTINRFIDIFI